MFEDPRLSTNYVDAAAIRRYNFFKGSVLVFLVALLLSFWAFQGRYQNPTITAPTGILAPGAATLAGTGLPGSTIDLRLDGDSVGTATVAGDGTWSFNTADLDAGGYQFSAVEFDPDGMERGSSQPFALTVEAPEIDTPEVVDVPDVTFDIPTLSLPSGSVDADAITIDGTGTPGSTVELFQNGVSIGTTTVGDDGTWSFTTSADGYLNEFEAIGFDPDGAEIGSSGLATLGITGAATALTLGAPSFGDFSAGDGGLATGSMMLSGEGEPGSTVEIIVDGNVIGTTTVGDDGTWSFSGDVSLNPGDYDVTANQILPNGETNTSVSQAFTIPALGTLALGNINLGEFGGLSLDGTGIPGTDIDIIIDGEVVDTVTVGADGLWSWSPNFNLPAGDYDIQVSQAGDAGSATASQMFSIVPFVTMSDVTVGELSGDEAEVMVNGRTLPNQEVQIFIDGELVDTVTADADGNWSYTTMLGSGSYTIAGRAVDSSGATLAEAANRANVGDVVGGLQVLYGGSGDAVDDPEGSTAVALAGTPAVEIILDASWSMTMSFVNTTRFNGAQRSLDDIVNDVLPEGTPFALRVFGNIEGDFSCRTDLMVPYGPLDRAAVNEVVANASPRFNANTPIAASLALVAEDLAASTEEERIVVLLTDGEETCDGDPAAAIEALVDAGFNVQVNIVGLSIADENLRTEFERWAELGGGTYYDVDNPGQLTAALRAATGAFYSVKDADGNTVASSRVGGQPLDLEPGTYTVEVRTSPNTIIEDVVIEDGEVLRIVLR
ncbi:MAG: Ig-like domain-containing protein [Chloroflexota bacterium]